MPLAHARLLVATLATALTVAACAGLLGIAELPGEVPVDATNGGEGGDGGDGADGGSERDARGDALVSSDGRVEAGGFCKARPGVAHCADFDEGELVDPWNGRAENLGTVSLVADGSISPPNALAVALAAGSESHAYLVKNIAGPFSKLTCSFQFRRDISGASLLRILDLEVPTLQAPEGAYVILYASSTGGSLRAEATPSDGGAQVIREGPASIGFPPGTFHLLRIEMDMVAVKLFVDGALAAQHPLGVTAKGQGATLRLGGVELEGNSPVWALRFDDVLCTTVP